MKMLYGHYYKIYANYDKFTESTYVNQYISEFFSACDSSTLKSKNFFLKFIVKVWFLLEPTHIMLSDNDVNLIFLVRNKKRLFLCKKWAVKLLTKKNWLLQHFECIFWVLLLLLKLQFNHFFAWVAPVMLLDVVVAIQSYRCDTVVLL